MAYNPISFLPDEVVAIQLDYLNLIGVSEFPAGVAELNTIKSLFKNLKWMYIVNDLLWRYLGEISLGGIPTELYDLSLLKVLVIFWAKRKIIILCLGFAQLWPDKYCQ